MQFKGTGVLTESYLAVEPGIDEKINEIAEILTEDGKTSNPKTPLPVRKAYSAFMLEYHNSKRQCRVIARFDRMTGIFETDDLVLIEKLKSRGYEVVPDAPEPIIDKETKYDKRMNKETIVKRAYADFGVELDIDMTKEDMLAEVERVKQTLTTGEPETTEVGA